MVGLALLGGAVVAAIEASGRRRWVGIAASATMAVVLLLALTLNGYGELFRRRDVRNDAQLANWATVLEAAEPLPGDVRAVTSSVGTSSSTSPALSTTRSPASRNCRG